MKKDTSIKQTFGSKPYYKIILAFLLLGICFQISGNGLVSAQATALSVVPASGTVYLNTSNTITLDIQVTNVIDLMTFDISFHYDPAILSFSSWAHGGMLSSLFPLRIVIEPGFVRLAFTQFQVPPVSGSGTLLRLTFSGLDYGVSPITMDPATLWNQYGNPISMTVNDGTVTTSYAPGTVIISSLSGEISLQGTSERGGIPVTLNTGLFVVQGPYTAVSLAQPGTNLFFNSVAMDAYPVTTAYPYYLNLDFDANKIKGLAGTSNVLSPLLLLAGNVSNSDNEINTEDLDLIKTWFDLTAADLKPDDELLGDANNDGIVDVRDLALAGGNFGLNGATAYQEWLP